MARTGNDNGRTKGRLPGRLEGVRKRKRAWRENECEAVLQKLRLVKIKERGDS
jgi:hypothetical protein